MIDYSWMNYDLVHNQAYTYHNLKDGCRVSNDLQHQAMDYNEFCYNLVT